MMAKTAQEEKRHIACAFSNFAEKKSPVIVKKWTYTAAYSSTLHNHDYPQLWYCTDGSYLHQVGDKIYECPKGSAVVIHPGVFHKFWIPEGKTAELFALDVMYDIFLDTDYGQYLNAISALFLFAFSRELGYQFPAVRLLCKESQAALEEYASWLSLADFREPESAGTESIPEKLEQIFSLPEFSLPEKYRQKAMQLVLSHLFPILRAMSYLNKHYMEDLREEEVLRNVGIGHTFFHHFFKCFSGYIYSQYLQLLRVKHVHIYLSRTTYSLSYISDMCGFCNPQYMSQVYKRYNGRTPRECRVYLYEKYHGSDMELTAQKAAAGLGGAL